MVQTDKLERERERERERKNLIVICLIRVSSRPCRRDLTIKWAAGSTPRSHQRPELVGSLHTLPQASHAHRHTHTHCLRALTNSHKSAAPQLEREWERERKRRKRGGHELTRKTCVSSRSSLSPRSPVGAHGSGEAASNALACAMP